MRTELASYQSSPCGATLGDFVTAAEPLVRGVARDVLLKLNRIQDDWLLNAAVLESSYRIAKLASRLLTLQVESESALAAYVKKIARGAARDAADDPIFGATRRNLKRRKTPVGSWERSTAISWPDEAGGTATMIGNKKPKGGGRMSFSFTDHSGGPQAPAPDWMTSRDRGDDWETLVTWVAKAAKYMAGGNEKIAVEQILAGESDAATAAKIGIAKATWQDRKRAALTGLAPRITTAASWEMDELGEKYLGDLWIAAANRAWAAVLHREELSDAA